MLDKVMARSRQYRERDVCLVFFRKYQLIKPPGVTVHVNYASARVLWVPHVLDAGIFDESLKISPVVGEISPVGHQVFGMFPGFEADPVDLQPFTNRSRRAGFHSAAFSLASFDDLPRFVGHIIRKEECWLAHRFAGG